MAYDEPDPNAGPWALPEQPAARPAWLPPGYQAGDPYAPPGGPPPGWQPPPPAWGPPAQRKGMPRWAKIVIGIWIVLAALGFVGQVVNLLLIRNY